MQSTRGAYGVSDGDRTRNPRSHSPRKFDSRPTPRRPERQPQQGVNLGNSAGPMAALQPAPGGTVGTRHYFNALSDVVEMFGAGFDAAVRA